MASATPALFADHALLTQQAKIRIIIGEGQQYPAPYLLRRIRRQLLRRIGMSEANLVPLDPNEIASCKHRVLFQAQGADHVSVDMADSALQYVEQRYLADKPTSRRRRRRSGKDPFLNLRYRRAKETAGTHH